MNLPKKIAAKDCESNHRWPRSADSILSRSDFSVEKYQCNNCAAVKIIQHILEWDSVTKTTTCLTKETVIEPPKSSQ